MKKIFNKTNVLILFSIMFCFSNTINSRELRETEMYFEIGKTGIHVPLGSIVLVREDDNIGAFKFINYENKKAKYEWYYPIGGSEISINKGKGKVEDKFWTLIGRLSFQSGEIDINVGPLKIEWTTSNVICFFYENKKGDNKNIELAPTNKENIEDVDINDPKIKWYNYDENRKSFRIPLSDL